MPPRETDHLEDEIRDEGGN